MMRILLISLAVVVAVLAFVLDQPWLYWTAGALLIAAVVALAIFLWRRYREAIRFRQEKERRALDRRQDLGELGIMEVRPRTDAPEDPSREEGVTGAPDDAPAEKVAEPVTTFGTAASEAEQAAERDPVLDPYLRALCAAIEAHTACLLVQDEMALAYRIEAAASQKSRIHATGSFETTEPLLTAAMTRSPVTVRPVGGDGIAPELLGYYEQVPALQQVAFAPVLPSSAPSAYFLVVDAPDARLETPRARKVLAHFAELLGVLLEMEHATDSPAGMSAEGSAERTVPRPRREIVAEEIEKAQRASKALALVLVHLNRAETLAEQGPEVVTEVEEALHARLEQSAPRSRVERFGEMTYGIFYNGDVADVEPWAERLQAEMKEATGFLAGGVSIGVAMMREGLQSAEQLREDATEALRLAYETGTCTIVE